MARSIVVAVVLCLLGSAPALAVGRARIQVEVIAPDGAPAVAVEVRARSADHPGEFTAWTDAAGRAVLAGLPPGPYRVQADTHEPPQHGEAAVTLATESAADLRIELLARSDEWLEVGAPPPSVGTVAPLSHPYTAKEIDPLPLGRDYRAVAQLAPGVNVVPNDGGIDLAFEPAAHAGNNYHDRGATSGSQDNVYRLDGFDVTGAAGGTGDRFVHHASLLEQTVVTSGVRAESPGGAGYVMELVTKAGSPAFHGSLEAWDQEPSMVEGFATSDTRLHSAIEDRWDAGVAMGGAFVPDRVWFFGSFQQRDNADRVELSGSASPAPRTTTFRYQRRALFGKLSVRPTSVDDLALEVWSDPRASEGTRDVNTPVNRYARSEEHPAMVGGLYTRAFGNAFLLDARFFDQRIDTYSVPLFPEEGPTNTIFYPPGEPVPAYVRDLGSAGDSGRTLTRKRQESLAGTAFFSAAGSHELEVGLQRYEWQEQNSTKIHYGRNLSSLAPGLRGTTLGEAVDLTLLPQSELDAIYRALLEQPGSAAFAVADRDHDGTLTQAELASLPLASSADNPAGVNFLQQRTVVAGANNIRQRNDVGFLEDTWKIGAVSANLGVRVEQRRYLASDGSTILDMDAEWLPRLGLAWSPGGDHSDGKTTIAAAYGRYADPLRTSMIRFAGNLSGSIYSDEVFLGDEWFSYRLRGSRTVRRDAGFAPNLRNESETELSLTFSRELGTASRFLAHAYRREDEHIIEDYDPGLYFNPAASGDLALTPGDFGYGPAGPTDVNYFLGNLVGAKRRTYGVDLSIEKRATAADRWSGAFQYMWKDAEGNSNSDAAADLQGDFLDLDPRQPWMWGDLPGTIPHQLKAYGALRLPAGFEIGGLAYWSSGAVFTESTIFRPNTHAIYYNYRRADGTYAQMGGEQGPSWWTADARVTWGHALRMGPGDSGRLELSLECHNLFDQQSVYRIEEGHNDPEFTVYREPRARLLPRRWEVGVRVGW